MLSFHFSTFGEAQVMRGLSRFADSCNDFSEVWRQIHLDFVRIEHRQFKSEGRQGGTPWAPLSPTYDAWKQLHAPGSGILRLTGELTHSMTSGLAVTIQPKLLRMQPLDWKARVHHRGAPSTNLPARRVINLTEGQKMDWVKMIQLHCVKKQREAGLK